MLIWIAIGIIAGWLASVIVGGGGLIRYLITGLIGAFVGGFLFKMAGININLGNPYINEIVVAAIGAIVVVLLARLIA
ncbi:GlsB/YeaQ/YmgE family stress response membrane protein [Roseibium salinum]|nr:GlsB/YeaQ/YmgE family stress response membrane protein [Roseibium salinum]